jgi:NAD(P)-dependent dehydrogenase (short-subunit alcohol dehydrogenase family)
LVVAVVGASSGIGRETALRFAKKGAKVVLAARSEAGLRSLEHEIRGLGSQATSVVADVSEFEQVETVARVAVEEYGRLDTWVHLAAVGLFASFDRTRPEEFRRVVEVDLMGQVYGAMAALPRIKGEGRGALVHVSSVVGKRSVPLQSAYCASKHGVDGFLESLRVELIREGWKDIGVTNVMPAAINTPFFAKAHTKLGVKPKGVTVYQPGVVADAILHSAEKAPREIVAGGAGKGLLLGQRISPRLMDAVMVRGGFGSQMTEEPKSTSDPDGLFASMKGQDRVEGDFSEEATPRSPLTWLDSHPAAKWSVGAAATLVALTALRAKS